jgi:hypothetical protein
VKKLLLLLYIPLIFSCGEYNETSSSNIEEVSIDTTYSLVQVEEVSIDTTDRIEQDILDFPYYSNDIVYSGCAEVFSETPQSFGFYIYSDSVIDMNEFDSRLSISLKFNWGNVDVQSLDVIKMNNLLHTIDINKFFAIETFGEKDVESRHYDKLVREDIMMVDVNMDSYLDISVVSSGGKPFRNSYFIYNPETEIFEFSESFNLLKPIYIDCKNRILYTYEGGESDNMSFSAYKMENNKLKYYQHLYKEYGEDRSISKIYSNANRDIILKKCWDSEGNIIDCELCKNRSNSY